MYGNLERGLLHGPGFNQVDLVVSKHFPFGGTTRNAEFRIEVFNVFDCANFSNPVATLPNALPTAATTEANKVQPGKRSPARRRALSEPSPARWAEPSDSAPRGRCSSRFE